MRIAFFASSLVSAYWNGAATYYRGLLRALAARGHEITFLEPDAFERQRHRDIPDPPWARVVVYEATAGGVEQALERAQGADLIVKASGVGVFDDELEAGVLALAGARSLVAFWDVDAPATLDRMTGDPADPLRALIPRYDLVFTYGGGERVRDAYLALGARECAPIYNALDEATHFPVPAEARFAADLTFIGNRLPDREARVETFFLEPAAALPHRRFLLGGSGWADKPMPANIRLLGHVFTGDHNAINCSARAVLNINRASMARYGLSPPTRIFEAAGAGVCIITDSWSGIDHFLEPEREVLVARDGIEVADLLEALTPERARAIGAAARRRVLEQHTYQRRAAEVDAVLEGARRDRARAA
ncbi:MAG TPA: glycosyltransferase [Geminicoccaceae bacterium]|nr:glycosyltransferase [Geminicoccaceae bacterium]